MIDQERWFKAAASGDESVLKQALDQGIDINVTDEKKNTALHLATQHAHQSNPGSHPT